MKAFLWVFLLLISGSSLALETEPLLIPSQGHAALPKLHSAPDGTLWLSWVERTEGSSHRLRLVSRTAGAGWSEPVTVSEGSDWFVNWADFPSVAVSRDGTLWAHWLRKLNKAPYAYEVRMARSHDQGRSWTSGNTVHDDATPTEHGFVSLLPLDSGGLLVAWLDGRATGGSEGGHGSGGAMTLRAARLGDSVSDNDLGKASEWLVDSRTCDCCQTAAAQTAKGPVVVYRGREPDEIRDIKISRFEDGEWSAPGSVHDDRWLMPACPVNGPAAAADGMDVWVAWYTVADGLPTLRAARSNDAGDSFATVVDVAVGHEVLGRVGLAVGSHWAWMVWLTEDKDGQALWLGRLGRDLSTPIERIELSRVSGRGRATGFPQLAVIEDRLVVVWTDVVGGRPGLHGLEIAAGADSTISADRLVHHGRARPSNP
ncbi:MAG: sialidase family protein [Xanthomonadaceae bacterium]|nr:sialidase family protein [Xanthomonadaceae bacterium]